MKWQAETKVVLCDEKNTIIEMSEDSNDVRMSGLDVESM